MKYCLILLVTFSCVSNLFAVESATKGKVIVSTRFDQPTESMRKGTIEGWKAGIGVWKVENGSLHGDEVASDKHPSSLTWKLQATNMVLSAKFRLGTSPQIAFGCRDTVAPFHHLGRTFINQDGFWITRMSGISKTTKSIKVAELKTPLDPSAWHQITIEIIGGHYLVRIDDHHLEARHERFQDAKGIVALISKGQGAQFKEVSIWHASPSQP